MTQDSLRAAIGVVTQDTSLLHRSVSDNIRYGRPDAGRRGGARRRRAAARADRFIAGLVDPRGRTDYAAHVGERGVKLSGGQRQRIAIARVILKDAPILVLDEATAALDSEVEAAIQESLALLMQRQDGDRHRAPALDHRGDRPARGAGRGPDRGGGERTRRCCAQDGLYARLWQRQSGGFLGAAERTLRIA